MGGETGIAWCDSTWNPWYGCIEVSPGCDNCYARDWAARFGHKWEFTRAQPATFSAPLKWGVVGDTMLTDHRSRRIFTCSLSDFFGSEADAWRADAWHIIRQTPFFDYLILTKRPWNIASRLPEDWGDGWPNVWLGTTAETQQWAERRIPALLEVPAAVHFLSAEPATDAAQLASGIVAPAAGRWPQGEHAGTLGASVAAVADLGNCWRRVRPPRPPVPSSLGKKHRERVRRDRHGMFRQAVGQQPPVHG